MKELSLLSEIFNQQKNFPNHITIPPGDDMGAFTLGNNQDDQVLITVDQIIQDVHFTLENTCLSRIGNKAMNRNLSDVAAMATTPVAAVTSICLPKSFTQEQSLKLNQGLITAGNKFNCPLIGGDVSVYDGKLIISVTVISKPFPNKKPIKRSGAKKGDLICVTGTLGGSIIQHQGFAKHLDFTPRIQIAKALTQIPNLKLNSMIDLSDGLATDIKHLAQGMQGSQHKTKLTPQINLDKLPLSTAANIAAKTSKKSPQHHALTDGEDYELCFTISPEHQEFLPNQINDIPITIIGKMLPYIPNQNLQLIDKNGTIHPSDLAGWEHHS